MWCTRLLEPGLRRSVLVAQEKGASVWLTALPLSCHGFALHKGAFRDALGLALRYGWPLPGHTPPKCMCGEAFSADHELICRRGGYPTLRHNEVMDLVASFLTEVCPNVSTEPQLQLLTREQLNTAANTKEACSVFYSTFALVLVPGLVSLLRTHAQLMLSSILLSFPLLSPLSLILQLQVQSQFPASCVSVFVPRTYTILATRMGLHFIPPSLQRNVLDELHSSHCGIVRTKELARSYMWWPKIDHDIESCVSSCSNCQQHRHQPAKAPLYPWEWPARPWQRIHIDFAGPFLSNMWLITVDAHSKWPEVLKMNSTTAEKTIEHLRTLFAHHGVPEQLVSDNGPQFTSEEFSYFLQSNGVQHLHTTPYHPATNGLAERFVQTFKSPMQTGNANLSIHARMQNFLLTFRNTPHATTKASPAQLLLQRTLRTRLDLIRPSTRSVVQQQQCTQASNTLFQPAHDLPVGATAMVRDYRPGHPRWISGRVSAKEGLYYQVEVYPGTHWRRHIDQIRPTAANPETPPVLTALSQPSTPVTPDIAEHSPEESTESQSEQELCSESAVEECVTERRYPLRDRKPVLRMNL